MPVRFYTQCDGQSGAQPLARGTGYARTVFLQFLPFSNPLLLNCARTTWGAARATIGRPRTCRQPRGAQAALAGGARVRGPAQRACDAGDARRGGRGAVFLGAGGGEKLGPG